MVGLKETFLNPVVLHFTAEDFNVIHLASNILAKTGIKIAHSGHRGRKYS